MLKGSYFVSGFACRQDTCRKWMYMFCFNFIFGLKFSNSLIFISFVSDYMYDKKYDNK